MSIDSLVEHAGKLHDALRYHSPNNLERVPAELFDPALAPLHAAWSGQASSIGFMVRWRGLYSEDRAVAARTAEERFGAAGWLAREDEFHALADWLHLSGFSPAAMAHVSDVAARLLPENLGAFPQWSHHLVASDAGAVVLAALSRANPSLFRERVGRYLSDCVEAAARFRKNSATGLHANELASLFAALTVTESLDGELEKLLLKLAGAKNVSVLALFTLVRHGHAKSVARLTSLEDLRALESVVDRPSAQVLYSATDAGPAWLRERLLDGSRAFPWAEERGTIAMACDLGLWDEATFERWFADVRANVAGAADEAVDLPSLGDEAFERVRAALGFPQRFDRAHARRTPLSLDETRAFLESLTFAETNVGFASSLVPNAILPELVAYARRGVAHFDALRVVRTSHPAAAFIGELAALAPRAALPSAPRGQLHLPDKLGRGHAWAREVRSLERLWVPQRRLAVVGKKKKAAPVPEASQS